MFRLKPKTSSAVAILLVVVSHADLAQLQGGAHVLLAVAGYNLARFQLGATFKLMDRPTTVSVDWRRSSGGLFLGAPREDRTVTLSVSRPVSDRVRASLALTRNASSAAPYDRDTVDLGVSMRF